MVALTRDLRWCIDFDWVPTDWAEVECAAQTTPRPSHAVFAYLAPRDALDGVSNRSRLLICGETDERATTWAFDTDSLDTIADALAARGALRTIRPHA